MSDGTKKPILHLVGEKMETCELDRAKMALMNPKVIHEKVEERTIDEMAKKVIEHCLQEGIETVWDRSEMQEPHCKWCSTGLSCSRCTMGPCRIIPERHRDRGVCGADADLIVARNLLDMCATGAASHSDHGREIVETLLLVGKGEGAGYRITDSKKLCAIAEEYNIPTDREVNEVAHDLALALLEEFGTIKGELGLCKRAPDATYAIWKEAGILPRGIDREIVEAMHRVHMGVGAHYGNMLLHGLR
ncbi:MAG: carbon monoxide dehydrogenase, partial [Methanocalculus sp.]|nr:carbon monoxide dehydrogenase [Methanocalculus sp.]